LTKFDREMLARYYVDAQSPEQICRELDIPLQEFKERKARAKTVLTRGISLRRPAGTARGESPDGDPRTTLSA
jgi:DNA-directed RNA polymerase specialized sigma24 family protein